MSLNFMSRDLHSLETPYLQLSEATCLTRRRAAALYLHAASRPTYRFILIAGVAVVAILFIFGYLASSAARNQSASQQAVPLTEETLTQRGYPRRYVSHTVKAGDTYYGLSQHYYKSLEDLFTQHHGKDKQAWQVIQDNNPRPEQPPFAPTDIPVAIELRIPLP